MSTEWNTLQQLWKCVLNIRYILSYWSHNLFIRSTQLNTVNVTWNWLVNLENSVTKLAFSTSTKMWVYGRVLDWLLEIKEYSICPTDYPFVDVASEKSVWQQTVRSPDAWFPAQLVILMAVEQSHNRWVNENNSFAAVIESILMLDTCN